MNIDTANEKKDKLVINSQQSDLKGISFGEPGSTNQTEEDLLDIPAFLRRQAN